MLHLVILLSSYDACVEVVAACAQETVYTPESVVGVIATALRYADTTRCAATVRHPCTCCLLVCSQFDQLQKTAQNAECIAGGSPERTRYANMGKDGHKEARCAACSLQKLLKSETLGDLHRERSRCRACPNARSRVCFWSLPCDL